MKEFGRPIIATSGNISEEPICITEEEAFEKLGSIADLFLVHNREILRHVDDSIVRHAAGKEMMIRRARGYAPLPLIVNGLNSTVLAAGAHLKNTIALNKGSNVFVSQYIGDLENTESINAFNRVIKDLENFYEAKPDIVICDLHPDYVSTRYAESLKIPVYKVQHHYAHVLSCMAENEIEDDVLGVSWDGTGYGTDGTIWGGEFILPDGRNFIRKGYLKPFRLPGGDQAIRNVWKTGYSLLYEVYGDEIDRGGLKKIGLLENPDTAIVKQMIIKRLNSPVTTSAGRLFDGVAAILELRKNVNFEAQAAMELEFAAYGFETNEYFEYKVNEKNDGTFVFNWHGMIKGIVKDINEGIATGIIAVKFHNTLAKVIVKISQLTGKKKIVLTGGCFLNKYLLKKCSERLETEGFKVYTQQRVPPGDGGISLGQMKFATYLK
jgi:hydrogenase maturation protein HypF